jgi:hypothetical protein
VPIFLFHPGRNLSLQLGNNIRIMQADLTKNIG